MKNINDVLFYSNGKYSRSTIKKYYLIWREKQNPHKPIRCDNPKCIFYEQKLIWNDKELKTILDHENGVNGDNRSENLRLLCPNCNSQLKTHGGRNKGKAKQHEDRFETIDNGTIVPCRIEESGKTKDIST